MISTNKNVGNLQDVKVSTQANTIALRSDNPESVILAIQFASKEGYDTVQSLSQGEVVLSKEDKGVLNVNRVAVGYKKVARGVEVNTPYGDYTEMTQTLASLFEEEEQRLSGASTNGSEATVVGEPTLETETPSQDVVEPPTDVVEEGVAPKKTSKKKSNK